MTPSWFGCNTQLTEQDIWESLEYEKILLARIEKEVQYDSVSLDIANTKMRIKELESR